MEGDLSPNDDSSIWDMYGKTPPRTKISRKNREKKQRHSGSDTSFLRNQKTRSPMIRRNTVSAMYDEMIANAEKSDSDQKQSKRSNKRQLKLLRGTERDLKLDIASAQASAHINDSKKVDQIGWNQYFAPKTPSYSIESCKRFMCLEGRTLPCHKQVTDFKETKTESSKNLEENYATECPQSRVDFYQTLSLLIRMGVGKEEKNPRRGMSREESLWQTELKDLIWLELQAYHADRSPIEEDEYLCSAREAVEPLLQDIMNYKFRRQPKKYSSQNSDSGVEDDCTGCNSIYCCSCMEAQNEALREVEGLMKRLEGAESLFPSSKAFAELYPLYNRPEFVNKVKAIILWFNMTVMQRLKLNILARLVLCLECKPGNWPVMSEEDTSGSSSDSNNSIGSSFGDGNLMMKNDMYNIVPLAILISKKDHNISPYRRYIENILKTRALYKSLSFLEALHNHVLKKVKLTLEKPEETEIFKKMVCGTQEEELIRYGSWSPEAMNLDLPSYKSMFLFLAGVPIEVIKEYLQMRLEQKPENPSPLSVRQLMRELKEGLRVAVKERERIEKYIAAVKSGTDTIPDNHQKIIETFEQCSLKVFKDYLHYLEQWVLYHHDTFQKNLLEEEFKFSLSVVKYVENGEELLSNKYANILGNILEGITVRLMEKVDDFSEEISKEDVNSLKQTMFSVCRELQGLFNDEREMSMKTLAFIKMFKSKCVKHLSVQAGVFLKNSIVAFKCIIPKAIAKVQNFFNYITADTFDETDRHALNSRIREILMQIYRFGFEFYKEMTDHYQNLPNEFQCKVVYSMVHFAKLWMSFVTERCDRGRGMRPRWANQGMEFLLTVCEPAHTKFLTDNEFEDLKMSMDECISHLIGTTAPSTPESGFYTASPRMSLEHIRSKSRGSSPSPRPTYKSQRSAPIRKISMEQQSPNSDPVDSISITFPINSSFKKQDSNSSQVRIKLPPRTHSERIIDAVETLEAKINEKLIKDNLIGKILECNTEKKNHVRRRNVMFSWQRGIKIGQGRFGKVYTAVNNNTGEMMAVKELLIQHNDMVTIKRVSTEMKILEGISHRNLVKYYGVEVYTDKMLLFMEFCAEGTLETLITGTENGLPELLVRKYTYQLLSGLACLHEHGVVHRDIKPANIFLTHEGNCLKIGDFGCAAKIKSNSTMPGELQGFVGTQAYMAPEVFTKNMNEGHGRAADIWSVGCVVIEMASGKRPWAQYDSNYQIMFKVGMGQSPDPPDDMIDEGLDFLDLCFKHNPKERASAQELLAHNFVKVGDDLI